jgi:hypothetical protein
LGPDYTATLTIVHKLGDLYRDQGKLCRFVKDSLWNPQKRREAILRYLGIGEMEQMEQTYLPVFTDANAVDIKLVT